MIMTAFHSESEPHNSDSQETTFLSTQFEVVSDCEQLCGPAAVCMQPGLVKHVRSLHLLARNKTVECHTSAESS
jgi:hypothetical protein